MDHESVEDLVHRLEKLKKELDLTTLDIRVQRLGKESPMVQKIKRMATQ